MSIPPIFYFPGKQGLAASKRPRVEEDKQESADQLILSTTPLLPEEPGESKPSPLDDQESLGFLGFLDLNENLNELAAIEQAVHASTNPFAASSSSNVSRTSTTQASTSHSSPSFSTPLPNLSDEE